MYYDGFHRSFCDDDDDLEIIQESDSIFAFETPETFKLENLRTKRGERLSFPSTTSCFEILIFCVYVCVCVSRESTGKSEPQQLEVWSRQQQVSIVHAGRHDSSDLFTQ